MPETLVKNYRLRMFNTCTLSEFVVAYPAIPNSGGVISRDGGTKNIETKNTISCEGQSFARIRIIIGAPNITLFTNPGVGKLWMCTVERPWLSPALKCPADNINDLNFPAFCISGLLIARDQPGSASQATFVGNDRTTCTLSASWGPRFFTPKSKSKFESVIGKNTIGKEGREAWRCTPVISSFVKSILLSPVLGLFSWMIRCG